MATDPPILVNPDANPQPTDAAASSTVLQGDPGAPPQVRDPQPGSVRDAPSRSDAPTRPPGSSRDSGGGGGGGGGGRPNRFIELLKLTFSVSAAFALLVAFGFLSEAASFQFLGLPQLQTDVLEMAEQGGRNFVDSFATLRLGGTLALSLLITTLVWLWWQRSRSARLHAAIRSVRSLKVAQALTAIALLGLLWSLVDVKGLTRSSGAIATQEAVTTIRRWQRTQVDWSPKREFARVEALSFEVGPLGWACRAAEMHPGDSLYQTLGWLAGPLCFSESAYGDPGRNGGDTAQSLRQAQMPPPGIGIPTRKTEAARSAARTVFGRLFAASLFAVVWILLLRGWRQWAQQVWRRTLPLPITDSGKAVPEPPDRSFYEASRRLVEPLMLLTLLLCLGLIPGAYGVLAHEGVGMQPVMVRMKKSFATTPAPRRDPSRAGVLADGADESTREPSTVNASLALICTKSKVDTVTTEIAALQDAWQDIYQVRPGKDEFKVTSDKFQAQVDQTVAAVASALCPEAYARLWRVLPREPQFSTRLEAAQYLWERWTELQRREPLQRFGYLVTYPRGKNSERLLLADALAPSSTDSPLRVALQSVLILDAERIEPLPSLDQETISLATNALYANPDQCQPITTLAQNQGPAALAAMIRLYRASILTKNCSGVLVTQIGTQAGMMRESHPLLHAQAIDLLANVVANGLVVTRKASQDGATPGADDKPDKPDTSPQSAADYRAAATALHLAGGPWAARQLVTVACAQLSLANGESCDTPIRWPDAMANLDSTAINRAGTLVTAAGYLANDASAALRQLEMDDEDCTQSQAEHGPICDSPIVYARRALDRLLEQVARNREGDKPPANAHSFGNRRAACTALGLSGSPAAMQALESTLLDLIAERNAELLRSCIGSAPTRMTPNLRRALRDLAQGKWPEQGSPATAAPPPELRRMALSELWESGLYFEHELLLALLTSNELSMRAEAAKFIEDVDASTMGGRLWTCADDPLGFAGNAQSLRCLRALKLLDGSEDGDDGLSGKLIAQAKSAKDDVLTQICDTLFEFTRRGGLDARRWLDDDARRWLDDKDQRICQIEPGISRATESGDARERWKENVEAFKKADEKPNPTQNAEASAANANADADPAMRQLFAALSGDAEAITALQDQARKGLAAQREAAFAALGMVGNEHAGAIAAELLIEGVTPALSYRAAQFVEDADPGVVMPKLLACAQNPDAKAAQRQRCLQGMALLHEGFVPSAEVLAALQTLANQQELKSSACLALVEIAARGGESAPAICAAQPPEPDPRRRWNRNLMPLLDDLIKQAKDDDKARLTTAKAELQREIDAPPQASSN